VYVVGGSAVGGAYGLVELFGALRFSSVLTISSNVPACRFGYLVDPVTGREDRSPTFQCSSAAQLVAEHEINLVDSRAAVECHFSPSWVHLIFRVMGPGEHAKRPVQRVARMGVGVERIFDGRLGVGPFGRDP
jgi:hypothetical protein